MTSPQLENGYTKIANELLLAFAKYRIPGEQIQCIFFILRKTYGWGLKSAEIPLKEFAEVTGINKQAISRALKSLKDKNVIIVIKKDNRINSTYGINKNYKTWEPLSKKITLSKKIKVVIKKDNDALSKKIIPPIYKETSKETLLKKYTYSENFEKFWQIYPKKTGKAAAYNSWKKLNGIKPEIEIIIQIIEQHKQTEQWQKQNGQFIPNPATWLNQARWEDEIIKECKSIPMSKTTRHNMEVAKRLAERVNNGS